LQIFAKLFFFTGARNFFYDRIVFNAANSRCGETRKVNIVVSENPAGGGFWSIRFIAKNIRAAPDLRRARRAEISLMFRNTSTIICPVAPLKR
jgi:hypothetical protein